LQVIAVNASNDAALERIRNLLPEEHRTKVIKKSLYDDVIKFQEAAYQSMPHNLRISALVECYLLYKVTIPLAIYVLISGYEPSVHQDFQKKAGRLPLPSTDAELQQYKHDFNHAFGLSLPEKPSQPQEISENVLESQLLCITELRKYVGFIHKLQKIKQKESPDFFTRDTKNKETLLKIDNQLDAIEKAITFLSGGSESSLQFTPEEIAILEKGFIGETLGKLLKSLPSDSSQQPGP